MERETHVKKIETFDLFSSFLSISDKILTEMMVGSLAKKMNTAVCIVHLFYSH